MDYLQLLLLGMCQQKTEPVEEATKQIGYVKRVCERYLSSRDTYTNMAYLAGVMVGEARVGSADPGTNDGGCLSPQYENITD